MKAIPASCEGAMSSASLRIAGLFARAGATFAPAAAPR